MKKKGRRINNKREDRVLITIAMQSVLMLSLTVMFFISAFIFQNEELKKGLYNLIRQEDKVTEIYERSEEFKDILGEAVFTKKGFEPVKIKNSITSDFGIRINPILKKKEFHKGIDIKAPLGKKTGAAFYGVCSTVGVNNIDGNYVILDHGNFKTKYCHLNSVLCSEGQNLRAGETVGFIGATGLATGSHLHFEIIKDGKYIDPKSAFYDFGEAHEI